MRCFAMRFLQRFVWGLRDYDGFKVFWDGMNSTVKRDLSERDKKIINSRILYAWNMARHGR